MGEGTEHERLAIPRRGHRAGTVIRPGAGPYQGGVPDPPGELAGDTSGRCGRCEVPAEIHGDSPHRPTAPLMLGVPAAPEPGELLLPVRSHKPAKRHEWQALPVGELLRSGSAEQYVLGALQHRSRGTHRIPDPAHAGHRSGPASGPVRHGCVVFHTSGSRERGTPARVELLVILQDHHCGDDRVQRRPAIAQHRHASSQAVCEPASDRGEALRTPLPRVDAACAPMYGENRVGSTSVSPHARVNHHRDAVNARPAMRVRAVRGPVVWGPGAVNST